MLRDSLRLCFLLLATTTWLLAQQSSKLVGTWVRKAQGFAAAEMRLVLNADGSSNFEGSNSTWRVQGNKLLLSEDGETFAYNFRLQGSQLILSGADLMAPVTFARVGASASQAAPAPPASAASRERGQRAATSAPSGLAAGSGAQARRRPAYLAGQYFYIKVSSFGSTERYINMCSDGRFSERRDIYSTGDAGTAYGQAGETAHWSAAGNENQGVVTVTYPNGETSQFQYRRSRGDLIVGGRKYARYGDGSCTKTSVY